MFISIIELWTFWRKIGDDAARLHATNMEQQAGKVDL